MGNPNSKRARRRLRGKLENDPNIIWEFGRWMERTVHPVQRFDLGNGMFAESHNETWHPAGSADLHGVPKAEE